MPRTTKQQRERFAAALSQLKQGTDLSNDDIAAALEQHGGETVTGSSVGMWLRAETAPSRANAIALARIFQQDDDALADLLDYRGGGGLSARLDQLDQRVAALEVAMQEIRDELRAAT